MKAYGGGRLTVEVEAVDNLRDVGAEFFPRVGFGDDSFSECFCDVTAVGFLV